MIRRETIINTLYATIIIVILTLTGIFSEFAGRDVIDDVVSLSTVTLFIMVAAPAYLSAVNCRDLGMVGTVLNGIVSGAIVGLALTIVVVISEQIDLNFVFINIGVLNPSTLTAGEVIDLASGDVGGLLQFFAFTLAIGGGVGLFVNAPRHERELVIVAGGLTMMINLVQNQIDDSLMLPDALLLVILFALGYGITSRLGQWMVVAGVGAAIGVALMLLVGGGALDEGGFLRGVSDLPVILNLANSQPILFVVVVTAVALAGGFVAQSAEQVHNGFLYLAAAILILGIVNWQSETDDYLVSVSATFAILAGAIRIAPVLAAGAVVRHSALPRGSQTNLERTAIFAVLVVMLIAPQFLGLYISNVFNRIALYTIMGIGLNVMVGYAGLLDLGYVASFAIGAYTLGILTAPNIITCGGIDPGTIHLDEIEAICTGRMTFWMAWPICVLVSAITGMALGVPVLRLRGDYLAIVTLGFGEIVDRIIRSNDFKPILGGAQGIPLIPSPVIDLRWLNENWNVEMSDSTTIYYLFLFGVIVAAFVVYQLINSRTGRAWRALKADEDVAQAMGINLMNNKLLAFGISSAFAGMGGAAFGASVQGITPDGFTLLVSINVLSLIIIGGMGSIPGVIVGALILIGLPELLRELDSYRLLAFGSLLVVVMLIKPEGLLPPKPARLSELAREEA